MCPQYKQQFNNVVSDTCDSRLRRSEMSQISITLHSLTPLSADSMFIVAVCCMNNTNINTMYGVFMLKRSAHTFQSAFRCNQDYDQ